MVAMSEVFEAALDMGPDGLDRFAGGLDPDWIEAALAATGTASIRRRKMPAQHVLWLVLGMAMFADRSIVDVVEHLHLVLPGTTSLDRSAVPRARARLGPEPVRWLFERTAQAWAQTPGVGGWRGFVLMGVDGTTLRVPDSEANRAHFGKPGGRAGKEDAGYPQLRLCARMNLGNRLLDKVTFGPFSQGETTLTSSFWDDLPPHSLTILDRNFVNYEVFSRIVSQPDRHLLVCLKSSTKMVAQEELPDGSLRVVWKRTRHQQSQRTDLPEEIVGRLVAYHFPDGEPRRLFTTLLDATMYPAQAIVELYHERWELEIGYDELKTHLLERREALRSLSPQAIDQEVWGIVLLYNLVRNEMLQLALANEALPKDISFKASLLLMRNFWEVEAWRCRPGNIPKYLKEFHSNLGVLFLPPRRSERRYPRHVKIKMSNYKRNRGSSATSAVQEVTDA
jgi:hypothetical protein